MQTLLQFHNKVVFDIAKLHTYIIHICPRLPNIPEAFRPHHVIKKRIAADGLTLTKIS